MNHPPLTPDAIRQLSGRELDAAVAERVLGLRTAWRPVMTCNAFQGDRLLVMWRPGRLDRGGSKETLIPEYHASLNAIWPVAEEWCRAHDFRMSLLLSPAGRPSYQCHAQMWRPFATEFVEDQREDEPLATALCRALLLAVVWVEEQADGEQ